MIASLAHQFVAFTYLDMFSSTWCLILAFALHLSIGAYGHSWTVKIMKEEEIVCAGTLLSNKFFLTLEDCIDDDDLEDYTVVLGEGEVRHISYILESPEDDDIIVVRLSTKVNVGEGEIARIPRIATAAQIVKSRQNSWENYADGIDDEGHVVWKRVDVLPDNRCEEDFEKGEHFCISALDSDKNLCSLMSGSPIVAYTSESWTLLGMVPFSVKCKDEQTSAYSIAEHRRWINKIRSLSAGSICTSHDDCGKNMRCEKNKCACTYCYEDVNGKCKDANKKVVVIGAGIAGITAAKTLGENGCSNVVVLEGSDRIGGRVKSYNMSGYTVELGAQWIYGRGSNPMYELAEDDGLAMVEFSNTWAVRDNSGNDVTVQADSAWDHLDDVLKQARKYARQMKKSDEPDLTAEALLRKFGWNPADIIEEAVESYELDFTSGKEISSVSGKYFNHLRAFDEHDSDTWLTPADQRGYSHVIEELSDGQTILFNKKVTSIEDWDEEDEPVEVMTEDGSTYEADDVIIAVSLGVLQSRQISFEPPLSEKKMMAIDKFGFGQNTIMYLKFPTAFWENVSTIVYASDRHGEYSVWYNMNTILPGCNIIQMSVYGSEAEATERMTDDEIIGEVMGIFRSSYPAANISEPESFVKSDWMSDPLTMGAYSYWTPAFTSEDMDYLGMSEGHLHFAGDYISETNYAFVHSAYTSGMYTATDLAESVKL